MSKRVPKERYEKTFSFKFKQWLEGSKDPYLGNVEMQKQTDFQENEEERLKKQEDRKKSVEKLYDLESNKGIKAFQGFYRLFSVAFCIFLVILLL